MATSPLAQPDIRNQMIAQMLREGTSSAPVQHWTQAASRIANALMGSLDAREVDREGREAPNELFKIWQGSQQGSQPQQHPLGPVEAGPRPASAPPAYAPPPAPPGSTNELVGSAFAALQPQAQPNPSDPRGIRNNNQLNIEAGRFTQGQPGYAGSDGRFARFENPQQGIDAASNLLDVYGRKHGINTVAGVINRWAPSSDGNPVNAYAGHVAKAIGVGPNDPINMADPQVRQRLVMAMGQFENGRPIQMASAGGMPGMDGGAPMAPQPGQPPAQGMPQQMAQAPNVAMIQQMINHPNPRVRAMGAQMMQQEMARQPKDQVVGDQLVRIGPNGQVQPLYDATKKTDDERNLAAENRSRSERGQKPLSMTEFKAANASASELGKQQGEATAMLPQAENRVNMALRGVDEIRNHPGRLHGVSSNVAGLLQGTPQYDFKKRVDQLKGGAFLEAFQMLKGGGAITEAEGNKASVAMERMDRALSKKDFDTALDDYQSAVRDGFAKLQLKARGESNLAAQPRSGGGNDPLGIRGR